MNNIDNIDKNNIDDGGKNTLNNIFSFSKYLSKIAIMWSVI